ncbi:efflux RND transporter permease subunit [Ilumatobacter sp.]|uniref:efflux RND transporter permease subunit n=1 Tax=Ilumatobacter sp. TaxID=1967498 RepID=UPI003AF82274
MSENSRERGFGLFEWIGRHAWPLAGVALITAIALAVLTPVVADDSEPSFDPSGAIYDTAERVDDRFASSSPIRLAAFIVETPAGEQGDVLNRDSLLELLQHQRELLADGESQLHFASVFDRGLGVTIDGVYSFANAVDEELPGGLEAASEADVNIAISDLLADDAPTSSLQGLLSSTSTTREPTTIDGRDVTGWASPAFQALVAYDIDTFDGDRVEGMGGETDLDAERWLRDVQTMLRGEQESITAIGLFIDGGLVSEEQGAAAAPYIFGAVAFILVIAGALLRSYWAAMMVAAGLGVVMMGFNGINALIGLKTGSPLLIMIVPIALISFGVDFFIHGSGRTREKQVDGFDRERAYPLGETAVFAALTLAVASSAAAFLSNTVSGIQAIIEFGIAAAIGLVLCYLVLGWLAPKLLLAIEERLGPRPADLSHARIAAQKVGFAIACLIGGVAVTMAIVFPAVGWVVYAVFLALFLYLPFAVTRRRNRRAAEAERPLTDEVRGAGHGFVAAGTLVHFLARWRVFTLPAVAILAVLGLVGASRVGEGFDVRDFFSSDTDLIKGFDKSEQYWGPQGDIDYILIEGDLTSPASLVAIEAAQSRIDGSDAEFERDFEGVVEFQNSAVTLVREVTQSSSMSAAIADNAGVEITDADADGLADTPDQIAAIYDYAISNAIVNDEGVEIFTPDQTQTFLYVGDDGQATMVAVSIATITDESIILPARAALEGAAEELQTALAAEGVTARVSGAAITTQNTLDAFTGAMLVSLPVAIVLTSLLVFVALFFVFRNFGRRMASILKRSTRYALISMVPILLVVAWVYGFMYLVGYTINVITATIAAIAVGVGVDYATHFTMRFIEEFEHEPSRFPALRRAGEGTGGALAISAATSMTGFLVMAMAPMPMFEMFGVLTAVMIFFSVLVSLLVLPSLLLLITPSRKGEEREDLIEEVTHGEFEYEPHSRETAVRQGH